jgi:alpha-D-xyloside xylohydrolase
MSSFLKIDGSRLIRQFNSELVWIEAWGKDSLRVRVTHMFEMQPEDWALLPQESCKVEITEKDNTASIKNGKIRAEISAGGKITFYNYKDEILLEEYVRNRNNL